ncbi:MAG: MOSC domain-containing protein [Actinomycetota bacterium]
MAQVARINITPVKSLALAHPEEVRVEETGVPGDRVFYLVDEDGRLFSAHDFGPLQTIHPSFNAAGERLSLTFPGGTVVEGDTARFAEPLVTDFYGRPVRAHVVPGEWNDALSRFTGESVRLARCDVAGDGTDVYHLSLVSRASVAELATRGGHQGELDARRFRMTFDLDGCESHEEDTWAGRRVRMGNTLLRIYGQVPRCLVTTQNPDTGRKDFDSLKVIVSYRPLMRAEEQKGIPFGMYAEVERPGRVRVGDRVEVLG